MTFRTISNQN